jgi:hypothetical protein
LDRNAIGCGARSSIADMAAHNNRKVLDFGKASAGSA